MFGGPRLPEAPAAADAVAGEPVPDPDIASRHRSRRILVVCYGNVCRSPVAAAMLRARLQDTEWEVLSAGTHATGGEPVTEATREVAAEMGFDLSEFRSRKLAAEDLTSATIIISMSHSQARLIIEMAPEVRRRVRLLGAFDPQPNTWSLPADVRGAPAADDEIPDPIGQDIELHRDTCRRLAAAVDRLIEWMERREARHGAGAQSRRTMARSSLPTGLPPR